MPGIPSVLDLADTANVVNGHVAFRLSGEKAGDLRGYSVATAGDVNGDGFADIVIGKLSTTDAPAAVYVAFGRADGFSNVDLADAGSSVVRYANGATNAGFSVSSAGDVNGDGFGDVIVGVPSYGGGGGSGAPAPPTSCTGAAIPPRWTCRGSVRVRTRTASSLSTAAWWACSVHPSPRPAT
jgi:hypothetical protein